MRKAYAQPVIEVVGTVTDLTQQFGFGPGSDSAFPIIAEHVPKVHEFITEGVS